MADENVIGGVKVQITGDFSDLQDQFAAAVAVAVAGGATLAEALAASQPILEGVAQATQQAAEQLNLFGEAEQSIPFQDANGQLNLFATEMERMSGASQIAVKAFADTGEGVRTLGQQFSDVFKQIQEEWPNFAEGVGNFIRNPLRQAGAAAQEFLIALGPLGGALLGMSLAGYEAGKAIVGLVADSAEAAKATDVLSDRLN